MSSYCATQYLPHVLSCHPFQYTVPLKHGQMYFLFFCGRRDARYSSRRSLVRSSLHHTKKYEPWTQLVACSQQSGIEASLCALRKLLQWHHLQEFNFQRDIVVSRSLRLSSNHSLISESRCMLAHYVYFSYIEFQTVQRRFSDSNGLWGSTKNP